MAHTSPEITLSRIEVEGSESTPSNCADEELYAWGVASLHSMSTPYVSACGCNQSFEMVDVRTEFVGPELEINPAHPPIVGWSFMPLGYILGVRWDPQLGVLDRDFHLLTTSRRSIPVNSFTDPDEAQNVVDALQYQRSVVLAQIFSENFRTSSVNASTPIPLGLSTEQDKSPTGVFNATATDPQGRTRLFQDAASTRVLESLLGAVLILSSLSWILQPKTKDVLPKSPTSLASLMTLLADSNIFEFLPPDAPWMTDEMLERIFEGCEFWLGWWPVTQRAGGVVREVRGEDGDNTASNEQGERLVYAIHVLRAIKTEDGEVVSEYVRASPTTA